MNSELPNMGSNLRFHKKSPPKDFSRNTLVVPFHLVSCMTAFELNPDDHNGLSFSQQNCYQLFLALESSVYRGMEHSQLEKIISKTSSFGFDFLRT